MTRKLVYSAAAQTDLDDIFDFIAADDVHRARSYIDEISRTCRDLCHSPNIGIARPDLGPGLRIRPFRRRIVIAYDLPPDEVLVLRIFTGGRDYEAIMGSE